MTFYKGFTSKNKCKFNSSGFSLTDTQLVVQDFINALNINQGELPGRPQVGSRLRSFLFDPNVDALHREIANEITRIALQDTRITVGDISISAFEEVIIVGLEIAITPSNEVIEMNLNISTLTGVVSTVN